VAANGYITAVEGDSLYTGLAPGGAGVRPADEVRLVCRPNPFSGTVIITGEGIPGPVAGLEVFDLSGRRVRRLDPVDPGEGWTREFRWNGEDGAGRPLPGGVYVCRVSSGDRTACVPVTLLR
jgi:hypothetical protein